MFIKSFLTLRDLILVRICSRIKEVGLLKSTVIWLPICFILFASAMASDTHCWAASLESGVKTEKQAPKDPPVSPEKLYESVSGYFEGLHRRAPKSTSVSNTKNQEQKRDQKRIAVKQPDKSSVVNAELNLARHRIQRGEYELAPQPLQRAFKMAADVDRETIQALSDRIAEMTNNRPEPQGSKLMPRTDTTNAAGIRNEPVTRGKFQDGEFTVRN